MEKVQFKTNVYREGEPSPLAGGPPVLPEAEPEPAHVSGRRVIAGLWYIIAASIYGAVLWTLLTTSDPLTCASLSEVVIAFGAAFALWGVTLAVRSWARQP